MNFSKITTSLFFCLLLLTANITQARIEDPQTDSWSRRYKKLNLDSINTLQNALKQNGPLHSWLTFQLADRLISQKKYAEAISTLDQYKLNSFLTDNGQEKEVWEYWQKTLLAQAYLGMKQKDRAQQILSQFPPDPIVEPNPTQNFYRELFRKDLQTKIQTYGSKKEGKEARARLWALFADEETGDDPQPAPSRVDTKDKMDRLHVLYAANKIEWIPDLISFNEIKSAKVDKELKCQVLSDWGHAHRRLRKKDEAISAYRDMITMNCSDALLVRAYYWKARIESGYKMYDAAIQTDKAFIKKYPSHQYTDDAYYALWKNYEKLGQSQASQKAYSQLINLSKGDMKEKVLWESAYWGNYKKKNYKASIKLLDKILSGESLADESHPRAKYWKARAYENLKGKKNHQEAQTIFDDLMQNHGFSFYSVLASHHLEKKHQAPSLPRLEIDRPQDKSIVEVMTTVDILNELHLYPHAQEVLDYFRHTQTELSEKHQNYLAQKWHESGDSNQAIHFAAQHLNQSVFATELASSDLQLARALFPTGFEYEINKGSQTTRLTASMIRGIIREESLYHSSIKSHAGATGFMQLMPATAMGQAKKMNLSGFSLSDLNSPQTNILLGAGYLRRMVNYFNGQLPLAVMAYNAGPGNVNKWLKTNGKLPLDEFIEEVPFTETRGYVKRVLRSMQLYGHLLNDPEMKKPFFSMKIEGRK